LYGSLIILLFTLIILVIIYDDLILMKFLKDNSYFKNILKSN
jgi:hypothetical protein